MSMPTITEQNLSLDHQIPEGVVTITVRYRAHFTEIDRFLDQHGLRFTEKIRVVGQDDGTATDVTLARFPNEIIPTSGGTTPLTVQRERSLTVSRASLQRERARQRVRLARLELASAPEQP
jgi:hypothetical protein